MSGTPVRRGFAIQLAILSASFAVCGAAGAPQPDDRQTGACCKPEGCFMLDDEYECLYGWGGTWYPGELCIEAGGDFECPAVPGACCTAWLECVSDLDQELCGLLYPDGTWHPGEACVEAGGDFVCPSTVTGACCTIHGCEVLTQSDCEMYFEGALWLEGEDCTDPNPCPPIQGACCLPDGCITTDQDTCWAMAGGPGLWYRGEACAADGGDFVCPGCPDQPLFCQHPQSGDDGMGWFASDTTEQQQLYERFWNLHGDICGVRWFGFMEFMMEPCQDVSSFVVRFFKVNDEGMPGAQVFVHQYPIAQVQATPRPEWSEQFIPMVMSEFVIELDNCIPLHDGYVSIVGVGTSTCTFSFLRSYEAHYSSLEGDNTFCGYNPNLGLRCGRSWQVNDLPIQLFGPDLPGACCDDAAGTCQVVMPADCLTGRFEAGVLCEDLDPPCGRLAGACCSETEPCHVAYEPDCQGHYAGDGTTCDPTDCNNNGTGDTCDIALGTSADCNANGLPDECDLANGISTDYDADGVPDECDPDRNANGVPDACDIDCTTGNCASHPLGCGGSLDCQGDRVPDDAQLGTLGNARFWDNGLPLVHSLDPFGDYGYTTSQEGGGAYYLPTIVIDDFVVPAAGAAINGIEFYTETSPSFNWTGRVHVKVFASREYNTPEGAWWQLDGDPQNATIDMWIPDDGGTISRTYDGPGYHYDRYKWTISGVDIQLAPGPWFIGMSVEASGSTGLSYPCYSHIQVGDIIRSEAWLYWANVDAFQNLQTYDVPLVDIAFALTTDFYGADANSNGIPDECEQGLICGDLNFDDVVDYQDYMVLLDAFGGPVDGNPPQDGLCDYDHSGAVGMTDFAAWLECYRAFVGNPFAGPPAYPGEPGPSSSRPNGNAIEQTPVNKVRPQSAVAR